MKYYWEKWDYENTSATMPVIVDKGNVESETHQSAKILITRHAKVSDWSRWYYPHQGAMLRDPDDPLWVRRKEPMGKAFLSNYKSYPHVVVYLLWRE